MKEIINKENDKGHLTEASMVGHVEKVTRKEMAIAMKPGKGAGPSKVCPEMLSACGEAMI